MNRKKLTRLLMVTEALLLAVCIFACGYKEGQPHELTEAESEAQRVTDEMRESNESTDHSTDVTDDTRSTADSGCTTEEEEPETWQEDTEREEDIHRTEPTAPSETVEKVQIGQRDVLLSDDEMWELVRIIYLENGITYPKCTYRTVKLTADVLLNRLEQWGYADAYEVIWDDGQYSTANDYTDLGETNPEGWEMSWAALRDALENPDYTPLFQSMSPQGTLYYEDPYTGECFGY